MNRRDLLTASGAALLIGRRHSLAAEMEVGHALDRLIFGNRAEFSDSLQFLRDRGGIDLAPGLIFALRFTPHFQDEIIKLLSQITGETGRADWHAWMLWQEANPLVVPHHSYAQLKRSLFLRIDPNFEIFLNPEYLARERMKIRLEEITWGGVRKDGIPSLDNPNLIEAANADYLKDDDLVFGISINGDVRAYPLRIMGWHEMFNEVIGGIPVALAYCTLCGSGILFETDIGRAAPLIFGSSGFLYRSNKLMFDRETHSLWNQFTGKPVMGPLVDSGLELKQRPVVIAPWAAWKERNPTTKVLSLRTGYGRDYGSGVVYRDYFASPDLMFPTITDQKRLRQKDYVFGIRTFGGAKAWPIKAFAGGRVINDDVGEKRVVLIGDQGGRTVRAYERGNRVFSSAKNGGVRDNSGSWTVTEEALIGPDGTTVPRVAGHIAYWFAWDGYLGAKSELYSE